VTDRPDTDRANTDCPDDNALNGWLEGVLAEPALARVGAHVQVCPRCAALVAALDPDQATAATKDPRALSRIGRFEVLQPLGEGGMGLTFVAFDPRLDREVCLKVLKALEGSDPRAELDRLLTEARAQARLSHPAIVPVYEVVADTEAGLVALVMELVRGGHSMRAWLTQERTAGEVLSVLRQAGEGLAAAHATGIVHRDFKPDNVMLAAGRVRLIDFGLARHVVDLGAGATPTPGVAARTVAAGTPAYMAPEQLRGEPGDARADQYSFCVTLYEALTGVRPFARHRLREQLEAQLTGRFEPHPRISPEVCRVLARGLAPQPDRRFPSMAALLQALEAPAGAASPRRLTRLGLAGVILIAVAAAAWALTTRGPTPSPVGQQLTSEPPLVAGPAPTPDAGSPAVASPLGRGEAPTSAPDDDGVIGAAAHVGVPRPPARRSRAIADLELEVSPPVEVWWKGRLLGRAPGHLALPPGSQVLELVNPELGARRRLRVTAPGTARVALAQGELELRVSPWAYVTIDGRPLGASPVPAQRLWEGPHRVRLERPERGYRVELTVVIAPGAREVLRHVVPEGP